MDIRAELKTVMDETLSDEAHFGDWEYEAIRPCGMPTSTRQFRANLRKRGDCSKGAQFLSWWTPGAPDPMQNHFGLYGNSQTMWLVLHHLWAPEQLEVGDPVAFGVDGQDHIAVTYKAGADPLMWSFGHQGAPNLYRLSYDRRIKTYLKLPVVEPKPTPQDILRAHTDFYSWVAWKLGEGPWKHYGPSNPNVRPNVGKSITLSHPTWWKRWTAYMMGRNNGNKIHPLTPMGGTA
jgi:hypothetical protein